MQLLLEDVLFGSVIQPPSTNSFTSAGGLSMLGQLFWPHPPSSPCRRRLEEHCTNISFLGRIIESCGVGSVTTVAEVIGLRAQWGD